MPVLTRTPLSATVSFLGINTDKSDLSTTEQSSVEISFEGFVGDSHSGLTRRSCVRVKQQYPVATLIRNTRQISALSSEELTEIQHTLELDELNPCWIGANIILTGIPRFTKLPPSSRLIASNGTSLVVDMENAPCRFPGEIIETHKPGKGAGFPKAALGKRGVTLWVEKEGSLNVGDELQLHCPPVCDWRI